MQLRYIIVLLPFCYIKRLAYQKADPEDRPLKERFKVDPLKERSKIDLLNERSD